MCTICITYCPTGKYPKQRLGDWNNGSYGKEDVIVQNCELTGEAL